MALHPPGTTWIGHALRPNETPNKAVEQTPNSLRSCLAAAAGRGSPPALDFSSLARGFCDEATPIHCPYLFPAAGNACC